MTATLLFIETYSGSVAFQLANISVKFDLWHEILQNRTSSSTDVKKMMRFKQKLTSEL